MSKRARFVAPKRHTPRDGAQGIAWPAVGHDDPESAECGAYLFQSDGEDVAYYCDPDRDLVFELASEA